MNKKLLIELPMDIYNQIFAQAQVEERSVRAMINIFIKRGMSGQVSTHPVVQPKATQVAEVKPVVANTPNFPNGIDRTKIEKEAPRPKAKKAKKLTLDDLTEKDLATAKVTFEERPDFKEPEKWDSHAWPTV